MVVVVVVVVVRYLHLSLEGVKEDVMVCADDRVR